MNLCDEREGQANTKVYFGIIKYSKWRHVTHIIRKVSPS